MNFLRAGAGQAIRLARVKVLHEKKGSYFLALTDERRYEFA